MEKVFRNAILCGYLLDFCESVYNSENIRYIISVMKYKEMFSIDISKWCDDWKDLDLEFESIFNNNNYDNHIGWPSSKISENRVRNMITDIWSNFFDVNGPFTVSFNERIRNRIETRVRYLQYYGPYVFDESLLDHMHFVHREIRPMFLKSKQFSEMRSRMDESASANEERFKVPYPINTSMPLVQVDEFGFEHYFELDDLLAYLPLYTEFLQFTREIFSSENLLCYQNILQFRREYNRDLGFAKTEAWYIYSYFVRPNALFEISVSTDARMGIELLLAKPTLNMFEAIEPSLLSQLRANFVDFQRTDAYLSLRRRAKAREGQGDSGKCALFF